LFNQQLNHRYQILKHLAQGGFGQTFLAEDEQQNSLLCVIKQVFLRSDTTYHQTSLEHLHQEVRQLAELGKHSQIPELLDTFEQDDCAFIVQEWIDGWTLEQEAKDTPFDEAEIWNVLREVLPVLQYLHDRQIIHRDIKPANIIRRKSDRQLVLVDFGAAKQITHLNSLHTGTMIGSVEYAAPEQIKGQAIFASDLYSLGVTCLYLLTQMRPFDLYDVVEDDWKWSAYLPHPISSDLQAILCKLLQPAVRRRYQSVAQVLADLNSSVVLTTRQQTDGVASQLSSSTNPSSEAIDSPTLKSIDSVVQKTSSASGAAVYLPPTQDWYYLPDQENNSDSEVQADFFLSSRLVGAVETPLVQEPPLFAEEIAAIKALPLVPRVFIVTIGAAIGSVAMACLVFCLGTILFALIVPPQSSIAPVLENQSAINPL
jgi:serine/threonine protein kinase